MNDCQRVSGALGAALLFLLVPRASGDEVDGPAHPPGTSPAATYNVRVHDIERRVDEIKEQAFRAKTRLNGLKATALRGAAGGSRTLITHQSEMSSGYRLVKLVCSLDGVEVYAESDESGKALEAREFPLFNSPLAAGNHTLAVLMVYQGNGYGVFSYLNGYQFNVRATHPFTVADGRPTRLNVVGLEKGNPLTTDVKDRPAIEFRTTPAADKPDAIAAASRPAPPAAPR